MNIFKGFDRLEFYNDAVFDQKIQTMLTYLKIPILHGDTFLTFEREPCFSQFKTEGFLVNGLEKTGAKLAVNKDSRFNDSACQFISLFRFIQFPIILSSPRINILPQIFFLSS
jgi:hypothetical protein